MIKDYPVTIVGLVGTMTIKDKNGVARPAKDGGTMDAGEVLVAGGKSACSVKADSVTIARIERPTPSGKTRVVTHHPLAPRVAGSPNKPKATAVKVGNRLIIQSQRDTIKEIRSYNLTVQL